MVIWPFLRSSARAPTIKAVRRTVATKRHVWQLTRPSVPVTGPLVLLTGPSVPLTGPFGHSHFPQQNPPKSANSEDAMGGWKREGCGKPHEWHPSHKRGYPPSYGTFSTPLRCQRSVFPVQKSTTEQTRSYFGGVQKFSGERVLWYVFLPPYVLHHGPKKWGPQDGFLEFPRPEDSVEIIQIDTAKSWCIAKKGLFISCTQGSL